MSILSQELQPTTTWSINDILALTYIKKMSHVHIRTAVEKSQSLQDFLTRPPTVATSKILTSSLFSENHIDEQIEELRAYAGAELHQCQEKGIDVVTLWDIRYPELLRKISYPPSILYVKGTLQDSAAMAIGIVGTRKCTQYGKLTTERFAQSFARNGCVVVSGLATGVDTFAHQETMKAGGITYAVIGSGIDCISPSYSQAVADKILNSGGVIISEYKIGTKALPAYFPQRNRIISGIAKAILVVESAERGGSLITAQFALDESRDVYAVPGNITNERSRGCNELIRKQMASIALSPEQILSDFDIAKNETQAQVSIDFSTSDEKTVYQALSYEPLLADAIAEQTGLAINAVLVALLSLEFRGSVRQIAGRQFLRL